jgi:hypothetical protein
MNPAGGKLQQPVQYEVYVVRLWREGNAAPWRAWVQRVQTGEARQFASLEALFAYLQAVDAQRSDLTD